MRRSGLVAMQIAVSVVLLVGAGLVGRSFVRLSSVDPGFDPRELLTARLELRAAAYPGDGRVAAFFGSVTDRVRALPSVKAVGLTSALPTNPGTGIRIRIQDVPETLVDIHRVRQTTVSPEHFATLGVQLLSGRWFAPHDDLAAHPVAIVSETLARRYFPDREAVGRQLLFGPWRRFPAGGTQTPDIAHEVIGVVADIRNRGGVSEEPTEAIVYVPHAQDPWRMMSLVLRTEAEPGSLVSALRAAIADLDPTQPVDDVATMQQLLASTRQEERFTLALLTGFALVATSLATIGVYSMLSHAVARRRRELAIRKALGADGASIMRLILLRAGSPTVVGLVAGVSLAFVGSRLLVGLLFETSPTDPLTFASAGAGLGLVSLLAGYLPARRAADTDVAVCVRQE